MIARMPVEQRVTSLETLMAQLISTVDRVDRQVEQTEREMREFKDEMREFKNDTSEFRNSTDRAIIEMRKQWGELSNKLGTMAEDLVAPSIGRILRETTGCADEEIESVAVRVRRMHPINKDRREFDVVAACSEFLLINETKSELDSHDINRFARRLPEARGYFPEYGERAIIGVISSLYVDQSLVRFGERLGLVVLGFGDDVMQVLNSPGFVPTRF